MATITTDPYDVFTAALHSDATRRQYDWALNHYMKFCRTEDCKDLLAGTTEEIADRFLKYVLHLNSDQYSNSMRNSCFAAVKLFYYINDVTLNWKKLAKLRRKDDTYREDKAYSKQDIEAMLQAAGDDDRIKAIILIYATSGVRLSGLTGIRIKDTIYQESDKLLALRIYPGTKEKYVTFITPQATRHVLRYLKKRFRTLEKQGDKYLIGNTFYPDSVASASSISNTINDILIKARLRTSEPDEERGYQRHEKARVHAFRKFFATTIDNTPDIARHHRERLLGHITGLDKSYIRTDIPELLPLYRKAIPALTFENASQPL